MKRKLLFLFVCLFTLALQSQAQQKIVSDNRQTESYLLKVVNNATGSQAHVNALLSELTRATGSRPGRTEVVLNFEEQTRISRAGNKLQLYAQLSDFRVSGPTRFRGFELDEVLLPAEVAYQVKLLNSQNNQVVKTFNFSPKTIEGRAVVLADFDYTDTIGTDIYKLQVDQKKFLYAPQNRNELQNRVALINEYYAADAALATAFADLQTINPNDIDRLTLHADRLTAIEGLLARLHNQDFDRQLNLRRNDPVQLNRKLDDLTNLARDRRLAVNHTLATLDQIFYNQGLELLVNGNPKGAQLRFEKALQVNPLFAPAHFQLAKLDFVNGFLPEAGGRTRDILTKMQIDPNTRQLAFGLANDIYAAQVRKADGFTDQARYEDALTHYEDARELCRTIPGLSCNNQTLWDGIGRAKTGIYRRKITDAQTALQKQDLANADKFIDDALTYQASNSNSIPTPKEAQDVKATIKYQFYLRHITSGKNMLAKKQYADALAQFDAAANLERLYTFQPNGDLPGLASKAARPVILDKILLGQERAKANRLDDARKLASEVSAMQMQYNLAADLEVQDKFKLLRNRIFTQECLNTQAAYDEHFRNAEKLVAGKRLIEAEQAYDAAIKSANSMNECGISTVTANEGKNNILPGATYQKMIIQVNDLISRNKFEEALKTYIEADKYFWQYNVMRFEIFHHDLFEFAKSQPNKHFRAQAVKYFTDAKEEEKAMALIVNLRNAGYPKSYLKKQQEKIGYQLATKDFPANPSGDPKKLALGYTKGNKHLKKVGRAYKKQWKRLD